MKLIHQQLCGWTACLHLMVRRRYQDSVAVRPQRVGACPSTPTMNLRNFPSPSSQAVALAASPGADPTTLFGTGAALHGIIHAAEHQVESAASQAQQHDAGGAPLPETPI